MEIQAENTAPALTTIGIDIGKDVFHLGSGNDDAGADPNVRS